MPVSGKAKVILLR